MRLTALLREIEGSSGSLTAVELAVRLGTTPAAVSAMLAALRAAGRLGPDGSREPGSDECASAGSCGVACTGPDRCPFVVNLGPMLEVRPR